MIAPLPGSLRAEHKRTSPFAGVNWPSGASNTFSWGDSLAAFALIVIWATIFAVIALTWFAPKDCPLDAAVFGGEHGCDAYETTYWQSNTPNTEAAP